QDNINPFNFSGDIEVIGKNKKEKIRSIQSQFQGFGKDSAKELLYQMKENEEKSHSEIFNHFLQPYIKNEYQPTLTEQENRTSFTALPYSSIQGEKESFHYLYELLDDYYENKEENDRYQPVTDDLIEILNNERKKKVKKHKIVNHEYDDEDEADNSRIKGKILTDFMDKIEQGLDLVDIENFYAD